MNSISSTNSDGGLALYETFANDPANLGKEVVGVDGSGKLVGEEKDFLGKTILFLTGGRKKLLKILLPP